MLNKELLMAGERARAPVGHMLMTIGGDGSGTLDDYYGWERLKVGSANRAPYWIIHGQKELLCGVGFIKPTGYTKISLDTNQHSGGVFRAPQRFALWVSINYVSEYAMYDGSETDYFTSGDIWGLASSVGKTVGVTFDPPPDGYLDPETLEPI